MQVALLIYESPEAFGTRNNAKDDPYIGAWRAYYKALVEAGVYVAGDPLEVPEAGTTVRIEYGKRRVQDGPYADTKEQLGGFTILEVPSLDVALEWAARCPTASAGAVEVRPLSTEVKRRVTYSHPQIAGGSAHKEDTPRPLPKRRGLKQGSRF